MSNLKVHVLEKSAVVSYARLIQYAILPVASSNDEPFQQDRLDFYTKTFLETRVWSNCHGLWKQIHLHRSTPLL